LDNRRLFRKGLAILIFWQATTAPLHGETYTHPIENVNTILASKALELFRIHSDDDLEAKITYALALIFWDQGADAQRSAFALIEDVARSDDPEAQYILGDLLSDGIGVKENYRKAAEWYEKAALSGYTPAQMALAEVFE
jgi:TPR repeat protein